MTTIASIIDRSAAAPSRRTGLAKSTLTVTRRAVLRYVRTPQLIVLATVQMSLFFLIYRYMFGGAIHIAGIDYVDYLVPGFIATGVLFTGIGTAAAMAEDLEQGFIDRLRSLPIPRSSVLAARAVADTALVMWSSAFTAAIAFAVGFQLHGSTADGLAAFGLVVLFGFAFEWLFIAMGLFAGNAQAAQGMGMIVFPLAFVSSAYVPVSSMPGWLQVFAEHQPLTYMVDAVRSLTLGPHADALLGHPTSYFVTRALLWTVAIIAVFLPLAVAKYRRGSPRGLLGAAPAAPRSARLAVANRSLARLVRVDLDRRPHDRMGELVERSGRAALCAEPDAGVLECRFDALRALDRVDLEADIVGRAGPDECLRQHPVL